MYFKEVVSDLCIDLHSRQCTAFLFENASEKREFTLLSVNSHFFIIYIQYCIPRVSLLSHRGQTAPLFPDDSTTAQEARDHHQAASQDEDIRRHGKSAGGQQAQVVALLH